jgi:hypothetical protein
MSRSYNRTNTRKRYHHSHRAPIQYQKDIVLPIETAYFGISGPVTNATHCKVRFHHFGKNYSLSTFGRPNRDLITSIFRFVRGVKGNGARSSTESIASSPRFNRTVQNKRSKSSSSSSSSSSSLLVPAASKHRSRLIKSVYGKGTERPPVIVRIDSLPRSSTPVRVSTPDTEPLADKSSPRSCASLTARRLFSSSSNESDGNSGSGNQPVNQSRAGQSLSTTLENQSASLLGDSQRPRFTLWDTETIPVKVIYNRAARLYQEHLNEQLSKPKSKRNIKDLESFVDTAEEELVSEQLAFEYYQAKRLQYKNTPFLELPNFATYTFNPRTNTRYVSNLRSTLNKIRSVNGDSTLDNNLEYYWYLNHKGHSLYLSELANRLTVTYDPSVYRQRILEQDIEQATQFRKDNACGPSTRNKTF